jgi:hypothetical protein
VVSIGAQWKGLLVEGGIYQFRTEQQPAASNNLRLLVEQVKYPDRGDNEYERKR